MSWVALGEDDLVIDVINVPARSTCIALALDPGTGTVRWSTPLSGILGVGPMVRSDGAIVTLVSNGGATDFIVLDSRTGIPSTIPLPIAAVHDALGVTRSDIVIALTDVPATGAELVAVAADGTVLWQTPGFTSATIAGDGTILVFDGIVSALDPTTGAMLWGVEPPTATLPVVDGTLTSDGRLVAVTLDGTLFGASD